MEEYHCEAEHIYAVTLSAELSGSYNSAVLGKNLYEEEYGEKDIYVFNSRSASVGETLIGLKIAECEKKGKSLGVVTQNIDGLHQAAGSKRVYEIHGSVERNYCEKCHKFFDAEYIKDAEGVPYCDACGGIVKPDVVLYEEGLSEAVLNGAIAAIQSSDVLVVLGTSLVVYPAAGLLRYFGGKYLVLVNRDATPYDTAADLVINDTFENVFPKLHI